MGDNIIERQFKENIEQFKKQEQSHQQLDTGVYWWIWGISNEGRRVVWGPYMSEDEAHKEGYQYLAGDFEVIPLKTKDEAKASRELRSRYAKECRNLDEAFKPFSHIKK